MFFTVTLPATLWFFDKRKCHPELVEGSDRKDKILFLDARNTYYQIDRAHREWKEEHIQNLSAIVRLYRGETDRYLELIQHYLLEADSAINEVEPCKAALVNQLKNSYASLLEYTKATKAEKRTPAKVEALKEADFFNKINAFTLSKAQQNEVVLSNLLNPIAETPRENAVQLEAATHVEWSVTQNKYDLVALKNDVNALLELWKMADNNLKLKTDKAWVSHGLNRTDKAIEYLLSTYTDAVNRAAYWNDNIAWLQSRFPDAVYTDVLGLCKMADRREYAEEQDYSLNAGRYVGVEIDGDDINKKDFQLKFKSLKEAYISLSSQSQLIEKRILSNLDQIEL
jgi:type I restriction enzyme M protein